VTRQPGAADASDPARAATKKDDVDGTCIHDATVVGLKVPAVIDVVSGTVTLPVEPGTDVTLLAPVFVVSGGSTVVSTATADWSSPVDVTVTSASGATRTWAVNAVTMRSPVLPGLNADPNIVRFGDTYYIYATTDGFPGWSSSAFTGWSSVDLVHWTEHGTILDVASDVSWADGHAWAPPRSTRTGRTTSTSPPTRASGSPCPTPRSGRSPMRSGSR
jgi:hypothetical protein